MPRGNQGPPQSHQLLATCIEMENHVRDAKRGAKRQLKGSTAACCVLTQVSIKTKKATRKPRRAR